jgi:uncharacterized circularly permuted ATP-grasp superfamily protein/uncharacterized alpha-E superfamily protein
MTAKGQRAIDNRSERILAMLARYEPVPGVYDEILDERGEPREHWKPILASLADIGPRELDRRFAGAERYLRDTGVFYRVYDDPQNSERAWPLAHIPLVIAPQEWASLTAGLTERAELLDMVLRDLLGPGDLVRDGLLPAATFAGSPDFLRPMVGIEPRGGSHLLYYAVDVGRGPDGRWWVLGDKAQAPSGAGYALQNRLAMARSLPEIYRTLPVERLASFFQGLRSQFSSLAGTTDSRVAVLTPGPLNETYFEHAFLARYLGFLLAEGADLTVRDDTLYVRTVSGLKKLEMVWRRLDADFADPLELNPRSQLGVAGLVHAIRSGKVTLANALGSGVVEARSILAFLPSIARAKLGRDLAIPHVATWWCGQPLERGAVIADLESFVVAPAFTQTIPGILDEGPVLASSLSPERRLALAEEIRLRGSDFVAQEVVKLSTMPVWSDGYLEPRPFILRLFLAKVGDKWTVMPGGFCRVGDRVDARAVTMQHDGRSADVCVLAEGPVEETTLLPTTDRVELRRATASLPSRAADNLFWLARYMERAEATLRLLRALGEQVGSGESMANDTIKRIVDLLGTWEALPKEPLIADPTAIAGAAFHGRRPGSLLSLAQSALHSASVIRDRFSPDAWRAIIDMVALAETSTKSESGIFDRVEAGLRLSAMFSGLAQENMNQLIGWRFLKIGKRIERALATCRYVRHFVDAKAGTANLDLLLSLADCQITYRRRYVMVAARSPVLDLVMLDPNNPRSVAFQVNRISTHLAQLPDHIPDGRLNVPEKLIARAQVDLQTADAHTLDAKHIVAVEQALMAISNEISEQYFTHRDGARTIGFMAGEVFG